MLPFPATANIISRYIICNCLVILTFMFFVKQFERQNYSLEYFTLIIILIIVIKRNSDAAAVWYVSSRSYCNLQRLYIYMHSVGSNSSMPSSTIRTTSYFPSHETCSIATFNTRWSYDVGEQSLQILDYRSAHHSCADKRSLIIQTLHTNDRSLRLRSQNVFYEAVVYCSLSTSQRITRHWHMMTPKCMEVFYFTKSVNSQNRIIFKHTEQNCG